MRASSDTEKGGRSVKGEAHRFAIQRRKKDVWTERNTFPSWGKKKGRDAAICSINLLEEKIRPAEEGECNALFPSSFHPARKRRKGDRPPIFISKSRGDVAEEAKVDIVDAWEDVTAFPLSPTSLKRRRERRGG